MKLTVYPPEAEQAGCSLSYSESDVSKSASYEDGRWHFDVTHSGRTFVVTPKFSGDWVCYVSSITIKITEGSRRVFDGEVQYDEEWTVELPYRDMGSLRPKSIPWDDSAALDFIDRRPTFAGAWDVLLSDLTTVSSGSTDEGLTSEETRWHRVDEIVVTFEKNPNAIHVVASADPKQGGAVEGGGIYPKWTTVTVTATAAQPDYEFSRWETPDGTIVSTQASYSFTAIEDVTLIAKFAKLYIVYYHIPEGFPKSLVDVLVFKTSDSEHTEIIEQVGVKDTEEPNVKYAEFRKLDHNTRYDFVCRTDASSQDKSLDRYSVCAAITSSNINCGGIQFLGYYIPYRAILTEGAPVERDGSLDVYLCVSPYIYLSKRLSELIESGKIGDESLTYDKVNPNYGRNTTTRFEIIPRSPYPYPTSGAHMAYGSAIGDNDCVTCGWAKFNISSEAINYFKKSKIAIAFHFPKDCILNRESISGTVVKQYGADELTFAFIQKYRDFDTSKIPVEVDADIQEGNPWIVIDIAESGLLYGPDHNLLIYDPQTNSLMYYDATE